MDLHNSSCEGASVKCHHQSVGRASAEKRTIITDINYALKTQQTQQAQPGQAGKTHGGPGLMYHGLTLTHQSIGFVKNHQRERHRRGAPGESQETR